VRRQAAFPSPRSRRPRPHLSGRGCASARYRLLARSHAPGRSGRWKSRAFALLSGGSLRRAVGRDQQCATNQGRPRSEERFRGRAAFFVRFRRISVRVYIRPVVASPPRSAARATIESPRFETIVPTPRVAPPIRPQPAPDARLPRALGRARARTNLGGGKQAEGLRGWASPHHRLRLRLGR
jgi:hypothetical protein